MQITLSPSELSILLAEADTAAARLRRRLRLPFAEQEDLRQELLLDLLRRVPAYDAARGSLGAFAGTVLRRCAARIAARIMRERRATAGEIISIDAVRADGTRLGDTLSEADGLAAWQGQAASPPERRIDIWSAVDRLDQGDRTLCAAVAHFTVDELVERRFGSRAGLYRRLQEVRLALTAYGLRAA
jgi:RNA polymerase sigma-70 factor (ECF subfamily)